MRKVREVLRQRYACGASERVIAQSLGIGRTAVGEYIRRAAVIGISSWRSPIGATVDRRIGEDAIGASPTDHPHRAGEAQRGEIDKTNPFPEAGQQ